MACRWLVVVLLGFSQAIAAGQVKESRVDHDAGVYNLSFDLVIDKNIDDVRRVVTDNNGLTQLSNILVESRELSAPKSGLKQRLLVARVCILLICRQVKLVERVKSIGPDEFITTVIPKPSDFKSGTLHWQLTKLADHKTRLEFYGKEEPDFWIPPVIGPILVKRLLERETTVIINNIENLPAHD